MADRSVRMAGRQQRDMANEEEFSPLTPAAFADKYQDSWRGLWCIAAAVVGDRAQADDVLQEAAMVALGKLEQFDPRSNFTAWMGQIVRFVALNHARRKHRTDAAPLENHALEAREASGPASDTAPLNGLGQLGDAENTFDDRLLAALRGLEETARACLLLRTLMDMPYRDISLALNIPEGTAMSHVHRARMTLRGRLGRDPAAAGIGADERTSHAHD